MSLPDLKVELFLDVSNAGGIFVLDSDSFGVLGVSTLSGVATFDVTEYVKNVNTKRGKSRILDYFNAGTATVSFNNRSRIFDPLNEDSVLYPGILPRGRIQISVSEQPIFNGFINDWNFVFDVSDNDVAVATCSDAFSILSNQLLDAFTPSVELTGGRINNLLNRAEVEFAGPRDIDPGRSTLGAFAVSAGTSVLNYFRQIEKSEIGNLFIGADGSLVFRDREYGIQDGQVVFSDDGTNVSYQTLNNEFGDELLYNIVKMKSPAGAEQSKTDQGSINKYQVSQFSYQELLNSSTSEVSSIVNVFLNRYREPKLRFTRLSVQMLGLNDNQKNRILGLDLTDYIEIRKSFAVGTPSSVDQLSVITGVSHNISPGNHVVSFDFEDSDYLLFLTLGNDVAGRLDSNMLDF